MIGLIRKILKKFGYEVVRTDDLAQLAEAHRREQERARAEKIRAERSEIAKSAAEVKADRAKRAVEEAIRRLEDQSIRITIASVSREANVARNTAKKYMAELGYR